jgi:hypothetical protein
MKSTISRLLRNASSGKDIRNAVSKIVSLVNEGHYKHVAHLFKKAIGVFPPISFPISILDRLNSPRREYSILYLLSLHEADIPPYMGGLVEQAWDAYGGGICLMRKGSCVVHMAMHGIPVSMYSILSCDGSSFACDLYDLVVSKKDIIEFILLSSFFSYSLLPPGLPYNTVEYRLQTDKMDCDTTGESILSVIFQGKPNIVSICETPLDMATLSKEWNPVGRFNMYNQCMEGYRKTCGSPLYQMHDLFTPAILSLCWPTSVSRNLVLKDINVIFSCICSVDDIPYQMTGLHLAWTISRSITPVGWYIQSVLTPFARCPDSFIPSIPIPYLYLLIAGYIKIDGDTWYQKKNAVKMHRIVKGMDGDMTYKEHILWGLEKDIVEVV